MRILALETATQWCSAALLEDSGEILERHEFAPREQTLRILPMVDELLAEAGWPRRSLDAVAFGQGPGAFTGVRVAVSVAQGLGFALQRPLVAVSTLASCALAAAQEHGEGDWVCAFDARMGEVYLGAFRVSADGQLHRELEDSLCAPDAVPGLAPGAWRGAGDGGRLDVLRQALAVDDWFDDMAPRAATVARLAMPKLHAGETMAAADAAPVYLRNRVLQGAIR